MIPPQHEPFRFPRELERRPPRPVRRRAGTMGCILVLGRLIGLVFLCAGLCLLFMLPITIAVVTHGESHPGQVQKTWISHGRRSTNYHVQFSYEAGGAVHIGSRSVSSQQYDRLSSPPNSLPLDVRALPISGFYFEQMFLPGESLWSPVWWAAFAALLSNGIAWLLVYYIWIIPWRHKILCRDARPVVGVISELRSSHGKTTTYYLDYHFDHPGLGVRVASMTVDSLRWQQARVGEAVS